MTIAIKSVARCKFHCESVTYTKHGGSVKLTPVRTGSPENESFYAMTPSGSLDLTLVNLDTAALFAPGEDYFLDITRS